MDIKLTYDETGNHIRFEQAVEKLGDRKRAHDAFRRGINHTGDKAKTRVIRALAKQMGLTQRKLKDSGAISTHRANFDNLEYTIKASGREIPLKEFGAKQFRYGVRAKAWGSSRQYRGAFIFAGNFRSGKFVGGGHVFKRVGKASKPIEKLYGPSIPKEMVKDQSQQAFADVALEVGPRIEHEVSRLTGGVVG